MPNYVNPTPPVGPKGSKKMEEQKKKMEQAKPSFGTPAPKPQQTAMGKAYNAAAASAKAKAIANVAKPIAPAPKKPMAPTMPKKKKSGIRY
jgi:hypothetical protein